MKIAIVGINYAPELTGIAVYTTGMAEYLSSTASQVTVYTAFPYYPAWSKSENDSRRLYRREKRQSVEVRRNYLYVPAQPSPIKRIIHEMSFVISVSISYLFGPRADCTIIISPPLLLGIPIALVAKLKRSKTIFHVQDLQPDAAIDLGMLKTSHFTKILYAIEKLTYRCVDRVSTISEGMRTMIVNKGINPDKVFLFRNWANDNCIIPENNETGYRRELKIENKFVVLYSGNMGVKQGLTLLLKTAYLLKDTTEIVFLIVGNGGEKPTLVSEAKTMGLENVIFLPVQPFANLASLLATADVSVIPQKRGVNDIVLPSKLSNIMASRRPLVAAAPRDSEFGRIVLEANCGILVEPENAEQMADAIFSLFKKPNEREEMAENGYRYMVHKLGHDTILRSFMAQLQGILAS